MAADLRIWPVAGTSDEFGSNEFEVVDASRDEPETLMISTFERCRDEYPNAVVES